MINTSNLNYLIYFIEFDYLSIFILLNNSFIILFSLFKIHNFKLNYFFQFNNHLYFYLLVILSNVFLNVNVNYLNKHNY